MHYLGISHSYFSYTTGLEADGEPFIAAADLIGCLNFAKVSSHLPARQQLNYEIDAFDLYTGFRRVRDSIFKIVRYGRSSMGTKSEPGRSIRDDLSSPSERKFISPYSSLVLCQNAVLTTETYHRPSIEMLSLVGVQSCTSLRRTR